MKLHAIPVWTRGPKLAVYALEVDGKSEVADFLLKQRQADPLLYDRLIRIFLHIAREGISAGGQWFRQLRAWPGQWEIKQSRHRLLGFIHGGELVLCLYRLKQGQEPARQDLERVKRLMKAWCGAHET